MLEAGAPFPVISALYHGAHGEALRAHWARGTVAGCGRPQRGQFCGGWDRERIERLEVPGGDSTTLRLWRMGRPEVSAADSQHQPSSAPRTVTPGR